MARIIDGKLVAAEFKLEVKEHVERLKTQHSVIPGLAVILVGDDPASSVYVRNKQKACDEVGIHSRTFSFSADVEQKELEILINELNKNPQYNGILIQMPLPKPLDARALINLIDPDKDVDGLVPSNIGKLVIGEQALYPCTPLGIMALLQKYSIPVSGAHAVIVGRSNLVGRPLSLMMLSANATVTVCHTKTKDLAEIVKHADILVAAAGRRGLIKGEWIKHGAVVIDVGTNRTESGKLTGDVEFEHAERRASFITPVPGGVGPMTIAMLLKNTVIATERQIRK